jgi:hypothetical protein
LQGIAQTAKENGDYLVFDTVRTGRAKFEFRTYYGQRGNDRARGGGNRLIVSAEAKNFANPHLMKTHWTEKNRIYAGGTGIESERKVGEYTNSEAENRSIWWMREGWTQNNLTDVVATLENTAEAEAYNYRARTILTGSLVQSKSLQFGITYGFGDKITAKYLGVAVDCHVDAVSASVRSGRGRAFEQITANLRGEL